MNINKRGLTLVELLAVIVVLAIISGLATLSMSNIIGTGKKGVYKNFEDTLKGASENYLIDNPTYIPNKKGSIKLFANNQLKIYVEDLKAPEGGTCQESYVIVTRGENDYMNNFDLSYKICLICKNNNIELYKSQGC